ncbi:nucleoside triphosphate pyrophosphohydrolase [Flocculibacter collagenilyticus]|uniref:nucleoside triphosphate pyrophosphohydrolase n=1 Tax=Flocculibacter collagenilyticus TaxID=2744479 RepID=UPI002D7FE869|nr:nucleoside triphosphate pyrophosphohydrolase [Flocculibacter collagenilyticus]
MNIKPVIENDHEHGECDEHCDTQCNDNCSNKTSTCHSQIDQLLAVMRELRDPETGCPWDLKQTYSTIVPYTLEEAYEVADAIEQGDFDELKGELGDLLFQVVFYAQLASEEGRFEFSDVVDAIHEKLIRRHPHVFQTNVSFTEAQVKENWEREKSQERDIRHQQGKARLLDNIPHNLPALSRANKIQKRCATVGFEWPDIHGALDKVVEEVEELRAELQHKVVNEAQQQSIEEELGDLFFSLVNVSRYVNADPEQIMRQANRKFEQRFNQVEHVFIEKGQSLQTATLQEMDNVWQQVKQNQKRDNS